MGDLGVALLSVGAGLACGFLNTAASSGSAVSLPILMMLGLDPIAANATNRIPVLIGGIAASASFHRSRTMAWGLAFKVSVPAGIGSLLGALAADRLPGRDLGLVITAAVLLALALLFTKLKRAIENAATGDIRYGLREVGLVFLIGIWLGFIVLDGATYMLLALTLAVGLPLAQANAIKSAALVPTTIAALLVFGFRGEIDWTVGALLGIGSLVGGILGARLSISPGARVWVFRLLVVVIVGELLHLAVHYVFQTHGPA